MLMAENTGESPKTPITKVPGAMLKHPLPEAWWSTFTWRSGRPLSISILLVGGVGSIPSDQKILAQTYGQPNQCTM